MIGLRTKVVGAIACAAAAIGAMVTGRGAFASDLDAVIAEIRRDHASVQQMSAERFASLPADNVIVFDVREPREFAVSRIGNATRIDPALDAAGFVELYGDTIQGKTVVFYCSVGRRSSMMAERVAAASGGDEETPSAFYNLEGGVFGWRNDGRALSRPDGKSTSAVHPYNEFWGRLIEDKSAIRYTPRRED